ncbi:hypothetical protein IPG41_00905 [Candidatus Peregrinibacteria bacterium]|nr:MAG: hypothetical protein IPG41_00905 [Candidatus Peregrinibacteria bacterium]
MALIDVFERDSVKDSEILEVLDRGLQAAETGASEVPSGVEDLALLFKQGLDRPGFLDHCSPARQAIYDTWLAANRARVDAVLNPNGKPGLPWRV